MPITGLTGIAIWDENDPVSIHGASAAQEVSIRNRINAKFATTTARDTAYSGLTDADKAGARCWVTERAGFCSHDGTAWQWDTTMRVIVDEYRSDPAGAGGATPVDVILTGPYVLPGTTGSRRISLSAYTYVTNQPGGTIGNALPRIRIETLAASSVIAQDQRWLESGQSTDLRISWTTTIPSGTTIYPKIRALVASGPACYFYGAQLQVFDMGPA